MRARLVTLLGFVIAVTIIAVTGQRIHLTYQMPVVREKLPPRLSSYLGVYEPGAPPEFRPVEQFSDTAGRCRTWSSITAAGPSRSISRSPT